MARGFGSTLGVGTTDKITTTLTTNSVQRSWSIWAYRNGTGGGNLGRLWEKNSGSDEHSFLFTTTEYQFKYPWSTSSGGAAAWYAVFAGTGVWHNCIVTYDGSSTSNDPLMYCNGVPLTVFDRTAPSGTFGGSSAPYILGNRSANDRNWDGMFAEFAVWDRILTADEVAFIGRGFSAAHYQNGLVHYDNLDARLLFPQEIGRRRSTFTGAPGVVTGTVVRADPTIIYPPRRTRLFLAPEQAGGGGGGFQAAWARGCNSVIGAGVAA